MRYQKGKIAKDRLAGTRRYAVKSGDLRWYSQIEIKGKRVYLGTYDTEEDAHIAYLVRLIEIGEIKSFPVRGT